jgi:GDP-L-fucose synthase
MNKILVTGGYGLVGSEFKSDEYYRLSSKEIDLRIGKDVDLLLSENKFDGVIHCAGKVGGIAANMNYKGEYFYENVMINTNIIESSRKNNIKNLVAFLSTCVFPDQVEYPLSENKIHLGPPHFSNDAYAYAKRMADIQIRAYKEQYDLNYKSVIPSNIYGPNDNYSITNGHVLPSLIHKCYLARENKTPLTIWGSGKPLREFIFSKDIAKLTEWVLYNYNENEPIILSTSEEISISEVVNMIVEIMNFKGKIIFDSTKPDGQFRKPSDNSKIKNYLPDFKFTPIYEGLKETIEYFENYYNVVRKNNNNQL